MVLSIFFFSGFGRFKKSYHNFPWRCELCTIQKRCPNSNCEVCLSFLFLSTFNYFSRCFLLFILLSDASSHRSSWDQLHCDVLIFSGELCASPLFNISSVQRITTNLMMEYRLWCFFHFKSISRILEYIAKFTFFIGSNLVSFREKEEYYFFPLNKKNWIFLKKLYFLS